MVKIVYHDELAFDEGFFAHVGLASNISFENFRRHYDRGGQPDTDRLMRDVHSFEPTSERWKEAARKTGVTPEKFYGELLELRDMAVRAGDSKALEIVEDMLSRFRMELFNFKH